MRFIQKLFENMFKNERKMLLIFDQKNSCNAFAVKEMGVVLEKACQEICGSIMRGKYETVVQKISIVIGDYFGRFSILFWGVISTSYMTPKKKSKIDPKEPQVRWKFFGRQSPNRGNLHANAASF